MQFNLPGIVAKENFLNLTSVLAPTTIFTPSTVGLYRVSIYSTSPVQDPGDGNNGFYTHLIWTDENRNSLLAGQDPLNVGNGNSTGFSSLTYLVKSLAHYPIQIKTALFMDSANVGTSYSIYTIVEAI